MKKKIVKYSLLFIWVSFLYFASIYANIKYCELDDRNLELDSTAIIMEAQIKELAFILEDNGHRLNRREVFNSIEKYTQNQSLFGEEIPKTTLGSETVFSGYNLNLIFTFDENDVLSNVKFQKLDVNRRRPKNIWRDPIYLIILVGLLLIMTGPLGYILLTPIKNKK